MRDSFFMLTAQLRVKRIVNPAAVILGLVAGWLNVEFAVAEERGIFDYEFQRKASNRITKIVFIGDAGAHGPPGNHEFVAGFMLLARQLHEAFPQVHCVVYPSNHWPGDLSHADAVIVGLNHGHQAALDPEIFAAVRRGAGFMAVHYGVEVNKGTEANNYLQWIGGYFETFWSVNPWWTPRYEMFRSNSHSTWHGHTTDRMVDEALDLQACTFMPTWQTTIFVPCCSTPSPGPQDWKSHKVASLRKPYASRN